MQEEHIVQQPEARTGSSQNLQSGKPAGLCDTAYRTTRHHLCDV